MTIDILELKKTLDNSTMDQPPAGNRYRLACVFLLLFEPADPHLLAIQKSDNEGYPWRNQVALPGGHVDER